MSGNSNNLISGELVASICGVKERTVQHWTWKGKIPYVRINGTIRYRESDIRKWINDNTNWPVSADD